MTLQTEWMRREQTLVSLVEYFSDEKARTYAEGCLCATRRCLDELKTGGDWVKGYEAGLRQGLKCAPATPEPQEEPK